MAITTPWSAIPLTDIDPDSPLTTGLASAWTNRSQHNFEWIGKNYTPSDNHNHDGANSALLLSAQSVNLINDWHPRAGSESNNIASWSRSGVVYGAAGLTGFGAAGDRASHILGDVSRPSASKTLFGSGGNLVLSVYVYADGPPSAGQLQLGLCDGNSASFAGAKATFDYTDLVASGWVRLYTLLLGAAVGSGHATDVRMLVKVSQTFVGASLTVNVCEALPGNALAGAPVPGNPGRMHDMELLGLGGCPVYDASIYKNPVYDPAV